MTDVFSNEPLRGLREGEQFTPTGEIAPADPVDETVHHITFPAGVRAFRHSEARPILLTGVGFLTTAEARQVVAALLGALGVVDE